LGPGDSGHDGGPSDAGVTDGGPNDAGWNDGGPNDGGPNDGGAKDGGDAGPIDYAALDFDTGTATSLAMLRGSPVLLTSWSAASATATAELPAIEALWLAHQHQLSAVAVDVDATSDHAAAALERQALGLTMPVWSDPNDSFAQAFGASGVPATALVDGQGYLLHVFQGALDPSDPTLLALLASQGVTLASGTPCGAFDTSGSTCILLIQGTVTDETGSALPAASITYCGVTTCFYGTLNDAGTFRVDLSLVTDPTLYALIVHGALSAASVYEQISAPNGPVIEMATPIKTPLLPPAGPALAVHGSAQAEEVENGGVALEIPANTTFTVPIEDLIASDGGFAFQVAPVDPAAAPSFAPSTLGLLALYALGPFGATCANPLGVRLPNPGGLVAGDAVEFLALDDDLNTLPFLAGTMQVVASGTVSPDGGFVSTNAGAGIKSLTWLGLRRPGG
jgi:peroxiredoxin